MTGREAAFREWRLTAWRRTSSGGASRYRQVRPKFKVQLRSRPAARCRGMIGSASDPQRMSPEADNLGDTVGGIQRD